MIAAPLRCAAFLSLCARSQPPIRSQTALFPSHNDFSRSQAGLTDTYVYVRTHTRRYARKCSRHYDPLGLARARPNQNITIDDRGTVQGPSQTEDVTCT